MSLLNIIVAEVATVLGKAALEKIEEHITSDRKEDKKDEHKRTG